jgi:hypothetical protein
MCFHNTPQNAKNRPDLSLYFSKPAFFCGMEDLTADFADSTNAGGKVRSFFDHGFHGFGFGSSDPNRAIREIRG